MKQSYLVKYGEIAIKGGNRKIFENALVDRIREAIAPYGQYYVMKEQGRIFVDVGLEPENELHPQIQKAIQKVFGITWICPVIMVEDNDFENLKSIINQYIQINHTTPATFKIIGKRADKRYPITTMEINALMGEYIIDQFNHLTVDVHDPEIKIYIEVRNKTYIYSKMIKGLGGMPVGTNGRATLLLSGGIDSPVAGYMIAKRGVRIDAVYFHSPPYTSERAKQKVIDLGKIVSEYSGIMKIHVVPFTDIQLSIYEKCRHDYLTIIMRRIMMRIAEHFANVNNAQALITGESIGQVASQTMEGLITTDAAAILPVFRPVIGMDKQEIIDLSQKIGTFETSILPFEDCCTIFVAKHPVTKPKLEYIEKDERKLVGIDAMIEKAILDTEIITIIGQKEL